MPLAPEQLARYREILIDQRSSLAGQVESLVENAMSSTQSSAHSKSPISSAENASDAFEQDFAFITMESEEDLIRKVDHALSRIREGSYGTCSECEIEIPSERLEALPFADLCIKCQEQEELGLLSGRDSEEEEEAFNMLDDSSGRNMNEDDG